MTLTVTTRRLPATDTRGARIVARAAGRQLTRPFPYAEPDPHETVACELLWTLLGYSIATVTLAGHTARGYRFAVD